MRTPTSAAQTRRLHIPFFLSSKMNPKDGMPFAIFPILEGHWWTTLQTGTVPSLSSIEHSCCAF